METIKEYLRSCWDVVRAQLAYVIRKIILIQTYGEYHKYATPGDEMIVRMLHLPPNKNKLLQEKDAQSIKACTAEYEICNRSFYNILNQICKDTDLHPYVKQYKSKMDGRGAY